MNGTAQRFRSQQGLAFIATLVLFVFLSMMIAVAVRGNMTEKRHIRLHQEEAQALCLAESGVSEAVFAIAQHRGQTSLERAAGPGAFRVRWQETSRGSGIYEIHSVGIADREDEISPRREVTVRAQVGGGHPARTLSWESSSPSR